MINIRFPDGSIREFEAGVNSLDVAKSISPSLAKATVAAYIDDQLKDAKDAINSNCELRLITVKDPEGLEILRHSCAHLLAHAVKELYPSTEVTIGPVVDNGFYYDFSFKESIGEADLPTIEKKMKELAKKSAPVSYRVVPKAEAIEFFKAQGENYKVEIIDSIADEQVKIYTQDNFSDLCRGPHIPNTSVLKAFKLTKLAGAYWRGNSDNEMLTRIYGTCWATKEDLEQYLNMLEEAEKRDHRKIGKVLDLFHFQEDSPGIAFWHDNGVRIWRQVEDYMRASNNKYGCSEIRTPLIADFSLWQKSGHASKYAENMFATKSENRDFAIRPMNCPTCVQVYNTKLHSYRDLPIRMAEFGIVHRNEPSGSLHGLLRVRSFTQDDGHIFCTPEQVEEEVILMVQQCFEVYKDFGFNDFAVKIALRPENRIGDDETWDKSEQMLKNALDANNVSYELLPGEGAFYGPKIEFHLKDAIGRSWQCGTIQLDFSMPQRLGATYIDKNGEKQVPVMLHRAIVGSLERFIGMLIEHYAGNLPLWLAPVQVAVMGISNNQDDYCKEVFTMLEKNGIRAKLDLRNEKIGFKIREHTLLRVPYLVILGKNEQEQKIITIRKHSGEDLGQMSVDDFCAFLDKQIQAKE
ncbi:threonine--tRNA ligase [Francisella tularensis subsp. novicida]|uniref:Threonine--tRNA ligase n=2 Tax=Francisella tularensis TaxID=263 RepID=SYT_FRATN|nr:threonine--tRNA ligase [Francisella tularensis]A0Q762.1 RecName: Full=Threonine--tRNA ligase; AltName: Full=Threonyl-tRNA synthetase; Short=ThrRS [Francisella tularensis subsp. novicida U112]ABK90077.1 threonyl-tRNA synthetase [Francisella tularensis subsp. novicida U112]AJI61130.1 threonine--tRNA ligase [Francisella tularensis subsp. novicida U112]APC96036.1 threonine--tRNA ligase [Francisella tularensis subsp. novicida]EDX19599.1 threonyl-tRNA synthetase [Francisella tularensis subsp. nov